MVGRGELKQIASSVDTQIFARWATAFELRCRKERYLRLRVEGELRGAVEQQRLKAGGEILLIGLMD